MDRQKIGFGTYRVTDSSEAHKEALRFALQSGISLIDTSSNYTDTHAETLIGNVLLEFERATVTIVSKFGYIQGQNMQAYEEGMAIEDIVRYQKGVLSFDSSGVYERSAYKVSCETSN